MQKPFYISQPFQAMISSELKRYSCLIGSKITRYVCLIIVILIFGSCLGKEKTKNEMAYDDLFSGIRKNSIKKLELNWDYIEERVKDSIKVFQSKKDFEKAIQFTLRLINDRHSVFFESKSHNPFLAKTLPIPEVESKIVGNNVGYLKIPGFAANDSISLLYSIKIRNTLMKLDQSCDLSGWIIDLRGNYGGKVAMFPLGISPLLKDSNLCYTVDNKGNFEMQKCVKGSYFLGTKKIATIPEGIALVNKDKKIAVLIDNFTASCGEFITLALKNNPDCRTFGLQTHGATSFLTTVEIKHESELYKSQLHLAFQNWANLNKNIIVGKLTPDVECKSIECMDSAIKWIENSPSPVVINRPAI